MVITTLARIEFIDLQSYTYTSEKTDALCISEFHITLADSFTALYLIDLEKW